MNFSQQRELRKPFRAAASEMQRITISHDKEERIRTIEASAVVPNGDLTRGWASQFSRRSRCYAIPPTGLRGITRTWMLLQRDNRRNHEIRSHHERREDGGYVRSGAVATKRTNEARRYRTTSSEREGTITVEMLSRDVSPRRCAIIQRR